MGKAKRANVWLALLGGDTIPLTTIYWHYDNRCPHILISTIHEVLSKFYVILCVFRPTSNMMANGQNHVCVFFIIVLLNGTCLAYWPLGCWFGCCGYHACHSCSWLERWMRTAANCWAVVCSCGSRFPSSCLAGFRIPSLVTEYNSLLSSFIACSSLTNCITWSSLSNWRLRFSCFHKFLVLRFETVKRNVC